ncbi:MAG: HAD family phosphatase [Planctomycetes bacterium]|nr:HAD family phosphatase [Planctomycetota bacterium]
MHYRVLACDYDGTLATHGRVDDATIAALERLLASGRKLLMVTGRELDELLGILPQIHLFSWIVAENGALLYKPATRQIKLLGAAPPGPFVRALKRRGVEPLAVGRVIVATWEPHETVVLETIRDLGLELQVIFNKGAVMVLPAGINKATGLMMALREMGLKLEETVGVGDAENDHAFLSVCGFSVAVANALPALKKRAQWTTHADHGAGVAELIDRIIRDDLPAPHASLAPDRSFYFRGPQGKLNLCAPNLTTFMQLSEGVDNDTWLHHLGRHDFSTWLHDALNDESLAAEVEAIEERKDLTPAESRRLVLEAMAKQSSSRPSIK